MVDQRRNVGATSAREHGGAPKRGLGWLWALLALLALAAIAAIIFLIARNAGDEGDDAGDLDVTNEESASGESGDDPATDERTTDDGSATGDEGASTGATDADAGSSSGSSGRSSLTSEGEALLPLPAGGLAEYSGKAVEATSVLVQSVVADEGFWVGTSETDRAFVFFAADNAGTESPVQVEAGRPVSFTGVVKPLPADYESAFEVDAAEGAEQLGQQGQYIEVAPNAIRQG